jgi:hypothetical protein
VVSPNVARTGFFRTVARFGTEAADALEHAHALGIVHRDVKPGNVLVDSGGKLWVTDFGLAKIETADGVTETGDLVGTLRYMSPEQALARHGLVDHRADIYGLGATLYELLTGRPTVGVVDRQETLRRIAEVDPVPPRRLDPTIPRDLETVVLKCLEKEPARRYAAATDLADDFRRFLAGQPVLARRPSLADRGGKWARRNRRAIAALAVFVAVAAAAVVAGLVWHTDRLGESVGAAKKAAETAQTERDAAREERGWAQQAVDNMYTEVASQWLADRLHLQPKQRDFLAKAVEYYRRDADREDTAAGDRLRAARAYQRLA